MKKEIIWFILFNITEPPSLLPMTFGKDVVNEGQFGQLVCTVIEGDEPFSFTWSLQGAVVSSEPGLTTSQIGSRTSMLMINSVGHRHRGVYTCNVSNLAGTATVSSELKVNGIHQSYLRLKNEKEYHRKDWLHFIRFPIYFRTSNSFTNVFW